MNSIKGNSPKFAEILNSSSQKICVIAGPGSGKTKGILVPKARQVIENYKIDTDEILLISFSRLSAQDLREKVKGFNRVPRASTLHSFCLSFLLSEDNHDIRKRVESIVIDFEKEVMLSDLKILLGTDKRELRKILGEFSAGWAVKPHDEVFNEDCTKRRFKAAVINWLDEHEAAMMEEIVYHAVALAKNIKSAFIEKPQYIFVDEYQDLNKLEQEFVALLGANSELVLVVGDPDQSIYSFKHAHPEGIMSFAESDNVEKHSLTYSGRCAKDIINAANQLLCQGEPTRKKFLEPLPDAIKGRFLQKQKSKQDDEYSFVFNSILQLIKDGTGPQDIIVLVPRKKLGIDFVKYAETRQLPNGSSFKFLVKNEYSKIEQEKILLLGILAKPSSILRTRTYAGLKDKYHFSKEFKELKRKYRNVRDAIQKADPNDFDQRKSRIRSLCTHLQEVRRFVKQHEDEDKANLDEILDAIIPPANMELTDLRNIFVGLKDDDDDIKSLYRKFIDYSRTLETGEGVIRVMTLIASKGLEAEYVFIIGCNKGNIPGDNYSEYLTDYEWKQEQRRLLFVGFTRAKKELTVSWSREIPYGQSRRQNTQSNQIVTTGGKIWSRVGLCEFLQDIKISAKTEESLTF